MTILIEPCTNLWHSHNSVGNTCEHSKSSLGSQILLKLIKRPKIADYMMQKKKKSKNNIKINLYLPQIATICWNGIWKHKWKNNSYYSCTLHEESNHLTVHLPLVTSPFINTSMMGKSKSNNHQRNLQVLVLHY